jgi:DNA mismatch endonuclease, patch repair protein
MSRIRGRDTAPELMVRRGLHRQGLRFRLQARLPGRPDLVFPRHRTVLFVHGCFWHRHEGCSQATTPSSNKEFWSKKFSENIERDIRVKRQLEKIGWRVIVVWSCELGDMDFGSLAAAIREP